MFSPQDIVEVQDKTFLSASKIWDSWSQDPIKAAVAQAVLSCEARVNYSEFCSDMAEALSQDHSMCFYHWKGEVISKASQLSRLFNSLMRYPDIWRPRMSTRFEEENRSTIGPSSVR